MVPDPQVLFWKKVLPRIEVIAEQVRPAAVITSSPMHSVHVVGKTLKRRFALPWAADFRDPYTLDHRFRPRCLGRSALTLHRRFERSIYNEADQVWHAIPLHARWASRQFPRARGKIRVLTHPVPQLPEPNEARGPVAKKSLTVSVVGSISPEIALLLAQAITKLNAIEVTEKFVLRLVGRMPENTATLREVFGEAVKVVGPLVHELAKREISSADILVNVLSPERQANIGVSSKLYEYAATSSPILTINPTRPDRWLLRRLKGVECIDHPDVSAVASCLRGLARTSDDLRSARESFRENFSWNAHLNTVTHSLKDLTEVRHTSDG
ncbi:MAG: hypothetical protein AAGH99_07420 [Planctomycetota bacterium]